MDIVTSSRWESESNASKFRKFYTELNLSASCNVEEISKENIRLKQSILYCRDEDKWKCSDDDAYAEEEEKSLDQVLKELNEEEVGQEEELSMKAIVANLTDTTR